MIVPICIFCKFELISTLRYFPGLFLSLKISCSINPAKQIPISIMADFDQLPTMVGIAYCPDEDVLVTNPGKTNHYVKGIASAIEWLDLLRTYMASEECGSSFIYIELARSIRHYLRILKTIIMAINNSSNIAKATLDYIEKTEPKVKELIISKNGPDNGTEVPYISPYELAIRIIIGNGTRAWEAKSVKDLMS